MLWLIRERNPRALPLAREILSQRDEDWWYTPISAVRALGELGKQEDIPLLLREYTVCHEWSSNDPLHRRNVLDAIEKIQARQTAGL